MDYLVVKSGRQMCRVEFFVVVKCWNSVLKRSSVKLFYPSRLHHCVIPQTILPDLLSGVSRSEMRYQRNSRIEGFTGSQRRFGRWLKFIPTPVCYGRAGNGVALFFK